MKNVKKLEEFEMKISAIASYCLIWKDLNYDDLLFIKVQKCQFIIEDEGVISDPFDVWRSHIVLQELIKDILPINKVKLSTVPKKKKDSFQSTVVIEDSSNGNLVLKFEVKHTKYKIESIYLIENNLAEVANKKLGISEQSFLKRSKIIKDITEENLFLSK